MVSGRMTLNGAGNLDMPLTFHVHLAVRCLLPAAKDDAATESEPEPQPALTITLKVNIK